MNRCQPRDPMLGQQLARDCGLYQSSLAEIQTWANGDGSVAVIVRVDGVQLTPQPVYGSTLGRALIAAGLQMVGLDLVDVIQALQPRERG